jgi:predicted DNA-binding protein
MTTATKTANGKQVSVRMEDNVIDFISRQAKSQHRTISNYLRSLVLKEMDETEYLMSSKTNRKNLLKSKEQIEKGLYSVKNITV